MKIQQKLILLIPLILSLASLACFSEVVESLLCDFTGGTYIWEGPEVAISYCDRSSRQDHEQNSDPVRRAEPTPWPEENGDQVFIGTTNLADTWSGVFGPGQVTEDEIIIIIDSQNHVFGSVNFQWQSPPSESIEWEETPGGPLHNCVSDIRVTISGEPSGTLDKDNNTIIIQMSQIQEITRFDCPSEDEILSGEFDTDVALALSGNSLTGLSPDGFSFTAVRQ